MMLLTLLVMMAMMMPTLVLSDGDLIPIPDDHILLEAGHNDDDYSDEAVINYDEGDDGEDFANYHESDLADFGIVKKKKNNNNNNNYKKMRKSNNRNRNKGTDNGFFLHSLKNLFLFRFMLVNWQ